MGILNFVFVVKSNRLRPSNNQTRLVLVQDSVDLNLFDINQFIDVSKRGLGSMCFCHMKNKRPLCESPELITISLVFTIELSSFTAGRYLLDDWPVAQFIAVSDSILLNTVSLSK